VNTTVLDYEPAGAARDLFYARDPEVLIEGPAGTGKTRGVLEYANWICETYANARVLFVRKTRSSLTESVLVTWEDKVLWSGHPAITGEASRETRRSYTYPNGAHIVVGGMDRASRIMSTEWDLVCVFEANEITESEWEALLSRLRNHRLPWQQAIADTNPDSEFHWLNQRANAGKIRRLLSRHKDNPTVTPEYLARLESLSGVRRERLYVGKWVSAEGQIWAEWDAERHLIDAKDVPHMKWYFGAIDWGFRNPGVLQIWGVDNDDNLYRVAEVYKAGKQIDWWAERVSEFHEEYTLARVICDSAEPRSIEMMNDRLGVLRGRSTFRIARKADKDVIAGLDQVRSGLSDSKDGKPRLYLVRDALRFGRDPEMLEQSRPTCTEEEVSSYVWMQAVDGRPIKERPDPTCADHGCDAMRYATMFAWGKDLTPEDTRPKYEPDTLGSVLKHNEVLAESA